MTAADWRPGRRRREAERNVARLEELLGRTAKEASEIRLQFLDAQARADWHFLRVAELEEELRDERVRRAAQRQTESAALAREVKTMRLVIAILVARLGGKVTIPTAELVTEDGLLSTWRTDVDGTVHVEAQRGTPVPPSVT